MDQPNAVPEVSEETKLSRRRLLKIAAATGGAVAASTLIPNKWVKPVVDVGLLPAHAQVSLQEAYWTGEEAPCCNDHTGYVARVIFRFCITEETTTYGGDLDFSGGTAGEECYKAVECNGGASLSSLDEVFAQIELGCHEWCYDICVYFDQRTHVTFWWEVCEGTDCVKRSVTLSKPD